MVESIESFFSERTWKVEFNDGNLRTEVKDEKRERMRKKNPIKILNFYIELIFLN